MKLGVIADDFTGASDIANTLVKGTDTASMDTSLFLGIPAGRAPETVDAGVVALKSRSIPATDAVKQSLQALEWLLEQGARQIVFKYCSTFDSTPEGNIGPVAEALANRLGVKGVVACPAFPATGRTVYQGHLFVHDRLLNESGLEKHPLNPMTDADTRRWLQQQCNQPVGLLSLATVREGVDSVSLGLKNAASNNQTLVIADAVSNQDLLDIGHALVDAPLITGGSGIAMGLPDNFKAGGQLNNNHSDRPDLSGAQAILAGSCSGATRKQIEVHAKKYPVLAIDVEKVMDGSTTADDLLMFINVNNSNAPLVYSSSSPSQVAVLQEKLGREKIAQKLDNLFATTARKLIDAGTSKLVIAGGETSGAVVSALNPGSLSVGEEIDPGVPTLYAQGQKTYGLALKSGNFGAENFFEKAIGAL